MIQVPELNDLFEFFRKCRAERMALNEGILGKSEDSDKYSTWYGPPVLLVVAGTWDHVHERTWDHTLESIRECAEIADLHDGWVSVEYPIVIMDPYSDDTGRKTIDTGFEVQVYPKFALRTHNAFVEVNMEEEE